MLSIELKKKKRTILTAEAVVIALN